MKKIIVGDTYSGTIEKVVYKGLGLCKLESACIFIPNTLPNEELEFTIIDKKRRHFFAKKVRTITPSSYEDKSLCTHFPNCGGCQVINVPYNKQLQLKKAVMEDVLKKANPLLQNCFKEILPSPKNIYYRNKMEFAFKTENGALLLGLKKRGDYNSLVNISDCLLQSKITNKLLAFTRDFFTENKVSAWDNQSHTGILRYLVLRESKKDENIMLNLVVSEKDPKLYAFMTEAKKQFKELSSGYISINASHSETAFTEDSEHIFGEKALKETLNGFSFKISPYSFFQTNSLGAEVLYSEILKIGEFSKTDRVLDLYCGTGSIGIFIAPHVKTVIGIEENPEAIENAKENAKNNRIDNCEFYAGRVKNILKFNDFSADTLIVDPPRSGMTPKAVKRSAAINAKKIVYVSCNPSTFIRDSEALIEEGYIPKKMKAVDMFPNTYHIETLCLFEKS